MKNILKLSLFIFFISNSVFAKNLYMQDGINLFKVKKFREAKFKFEQEIVLNPKSEISYLYLAKIFKNLDKKDLQEKNLNTVILLNPKNEEAVYNLAKLKLENSDYDKSRKLNEKLKIICNQFCNESKKLKIEIENLSQK